ncbi:hypothetical protein KIH39_11860 [Telmatocola sphagniphila]|uniref:Uncharacterized protein n=1 Tax=Telmatocola sphagniphila TaxID=1123043 RepID=A0A8E6EX71_9BACT|nr:hypothetical protein [Telmatocola sphagniphila]QVL34567.1 hypothetical protein KIH39_11860 [Telmatocola sphagniphila]
MSPTRMSTKASPFLSPKSQEESVVDEREKFSPAEFVQRKLQDLLPKRTILVGSMRTNRVVHRYGSPVSTY